MLTKIYFTLLLIFILTIATYADTSIAVKSPEDAIQWTLVSPQKTKGISGIAPLDNAQFLVVHDSKKNEQPRLGIVNWGGDTISWLTPLNWCNKDFPIDLEAISAIPNHQNQYLVLESKGTVTRIELNKTECKTLNQFTLPTATTDSNMEGLFLHCVKDKCLLVWAERGDDKTAAKFSWAEFNSDKNTLSTVAASQFMADYPNTHRRSISDLAIDDKGVLWVSSTSDPGDDGPFQSALYVLGNFTLTDSVWNWNAATPANLKYKNESLKIEAIAFTPTQLILGTDDENQGSKIAVKLLP